MLGFGLGLSQNVAWSPSDIQDLQFWAGGFDPSQGRLFQDSAVMAALTGAGQPLGLLRRAAGGFDVSQATSFSKPTLGRYPKSGLRNLAMGAQAVGNNNYWRDSFVTNGVTCSKMGHGAELDGEPYVDLRFTGVPTATSITGAYNHANMLMEAEVGAQFSSRYKVKLLSAVSLEAVNGFRATVSSISSTGSYLGETASETVLPTAGYADCAVSAVVAFASTAKVRNAVILHCNVGQSAAPIDLTVRICAMQFETGLSLTPLQRNYGPSDVTEAGLPDLWHLYNDGGDSLPLILPAGTYGIASLPVSKEPVFESVTVNGSTAINLLRQERQLDVVVKQGAFSASQMSELRNFWRGRVA